MATDVYIIGTCGCGGRIIAPVLTHKHMRPQPPVCERSGKVSLECTMLAPPGSPMPSAGKGEGSDAGTEPTKHFIMETR